MKMGRPRIDPKIPDWFENENYRFVNNLTDQDFLANIKVRHDLLFNLNRFPTLPDALLSQYWSFIRTQSNATHDAIETINFEYDGKEKGKRESGSTSFFNLSEASRHHRISEQKYISDLDGMQALRISIEVENKRQVLDLDSPYKNDDPMKKYICVDLDAPNSIIKAQFEQWLKNQNVQENIRFQYKASKIRNLVVANNLLEIADLKIWALLNDEVLEAKFFIKAIWDERGFTNPYDKFTLACKYFSNIFENSSSIKVMQDKLSNLKH